MSLLCRFLLLVLLGADWVAAEESALPKAHQTRQIQGWTVRIDERLLSGESSADGATALALLESRLGDIVRLMAPGPLARLREVPIQVDQSHGALKAAQYHPNPVWLREHGYSETLAKCVHISSVKQFISPWENHRMPWMLLHELAHAYHDRVLGFEDPRIIKVWEKFRDSGKYESVLTIKGDKRRHYGLTNAKEFFAEMTESYFGTNDFYPFVTGELEEAEPEVFAVLREIWGELPGR